MPRLAVLTSSVLLVILSSGCEEPDGEIDEEVTDTAPTDTLLAAPDSMEQWIRIGERSVVRLPNGAACLIVPAATAPAPPIDSPFVRITIATRSAGPGGPFEAEDLAAFREAEAAGHTVFGPIYDYGAYDMDDQRFTEFTGDSVIVALCVEHRSDQADARARALVARPDPENPTSVQFFERRAVPPECRLACESLEGAAAPQGTAVNAARWLTGSPVYPSAAYAAETEFKGISGGGTGNSPFAAVDPESGTTAQ